ncbi:MAG: TlyA family RNA methyltransferase [Sciscionella sp.]
MPRRARLDAELVRRGLARSRAHASELIAAGRVSVRGIQASKPATAIDADASVVVREDVADPGWASRGAHKLLGALETFTPAGLSVAGRRCLDAGASTGGFTDVLLAAGARQVVAVDVGRGLLLWRLRTDERVVLLERTNIRHLELGDIGEPVELVVADLSFISLGLVLPALIGCTTGDADLVLMVKPQFEVGKQRVGAGGVVRTPWVRTDAVRWVVAQAAELGLGLRGVVASPLPGPSGNVEYFVWLCRGEPLPEERIAELVRAAVEEGPQ